jgi:drug/metabolite transporter (DMT)-like permease
LKPTQLQFYTSVAALALQTPFVIRDAGVLLQSWGSTEDDAEDTSSISIGTLLLMDAIFYHLQSVSAYCTMGCMSPVSQSVANTLKRSLLVWASILYFGNPVTSNGVIGIIMVVSGVFLYNHVRSNHQR